METQLSKKRKKPMSKKEYARSCGIACPFCESTNLDSGGVDINGGFVVQDTSCRDCKEEWVDIYQLKGYHR